MKTPTSSLAAIYVRVSTDEQVGRGGLLSCDAQEATCRAHAQKMGLDVVATYRDEGRSGTNLRRPGWRDLLAGAQAGQFGVVVVTYMDRLGRNEGYVIAREDLRRAGARVELALERFEDDLGGYLAENMTRVLGGVYAKEIGRKTRSKMQEMVRAGLWPGGPSAPAGYRLVQAEDFPAGPRSHPQRLVPDPDAAGAVAAAFDALVAGGRLEAGRDALVGGLSRGFTPAQARRLFTSTIYRGRMVWGDVEVEGYCEPIVEEGVWSAAQRVLSERRRAIPSFAPRPVQGAQGDGADVEPWYFRGLVRCASCGSPMTPYWSRNRQGKRYGYYECTASRGGACAQPRVSAPRLHETFATAILGAATSPWRLRRLLEEAARHAPDTSEASRELGAAVREEAAASARVERLEERIEDAPSKAVAAALMERLDAQLALREEAREKVQGARRRLAAAKVVPTRDRLAAVLGRVEEAWGLATAPQRVEIARLLLEGVEMDGRTAWFEVRMSTALSGESQEGGLEKDRKQRTYVHGDSNTPSQIAPLCVLPARVEARR